MAHVGQEFRFGAAGAFGGFLGLDQGLLGFQAFQFAAGARPEHGQKRFRQLDVGQGLAPDDGDQAARPAGAVPEGDAHVAFGVHLLQHGVVRKAFPHAAGEAAYGLAHDNAAGGVGQGVGDVVLEMAVAEKRKRGGAQPVALQPVDAYERHVQRLGQVRGQGMEEVPSVLAVAAGGQKRQRAFERLASGDVEADAPVTHHAPVGVEHRPAHGEQPAFLSGRPCRAPFDGDVLAVRQRLLHGRFHRGQVRGMHGLPPAVVGGLHGLPVEAVQGPDLLGPDVFVGLGVPFPDAGLGRVQGHDQPVRPALRFLPGRAQFVCARGDEVFEFLVAAAQHGLRFLERRHVGVGEHRAAHGPVLFAVGQHAAQVHPAVVAPDFVFGRRLAAQDGVHVRHEGFVVHPGFDRRKRAAHVLHRDMEDLQGGRGGAHDASLPVEKHRGDLGGGEQVLHEGMRPAEFLDLVGQLLV
ncbi:hypothetical protein DSECCO2_609530 [anaerobic digester metagenome]